MEEKFKVEKVSERALTIPVIEETLKGCYGEFKRYRLGKMYIQPSDIKGEKVSITTLAKHIYNQEKEQERSM